MQRITLMTYGTRGDIQPFLALAQGLQRAGWRVRLALPGAYLALADACELDCVALPGDPAALSEIINARSGADLNTMLRAVRSFALPIAEDMIDGLRDACRDADAVVHTFLLTVAGHTIARERGVPDISAQFFPIFAPTAAFPGPVFRRSWGRWLNRATHRLLSAIFWFASRAGYRHLHRRTPHLPQRVYWPWARESRSSTPLLFAFSPLVVPPPADWPHYVHVTGYWFDEDNPNWLPPAGLERFLAAGPPPICVCLGSVVHRSLPALRDIVLAALDETGQRGILLGCWAGRDRGDLPPTVCQVDAAPHDWLFPHVAAVIHHGGAGTTAAALRAGVPAVVTPFAADQFFWGHRLHTLGAGPRPIPARRLTIRRLSVALGAVLWDQKTRAHATALGQLLRTEDGISRAVALIEEHVSAVRAA